LIMFIPSTFKRPVSSWKALNLRKTLLMASSVRLKPMNCSRLPCVYAQETLTFLLTLKKTCVKNYVQKEHRNFTRRQVAIQNRVASNIGISQSTFSVKVLNLFSRSRRKTNKRKSKHSAMLRNKETRHRMFIGLLNTTR